MHRYESHATRSGGAGNGRLTGGTGADRVGGSPGTDAITDAITDFTPSQGDAKDTTIP